MNTFITTNVSLREKNWFKTGGSAQYYCEPTTTIEFQYALHFAAKNNLEIFVLGEGANILVSDNGFDGLVIHPQLKDFFVTTTYQECFVTAGAGTTLEDLIEHCFNNNITGLEEFSGIPGTVGGATYINLHYFQFLFSQFICAATVIHKITGDIKTVNNAWFNYGYNQSTLMNHEYFIVDVTFKLKHATDLEIAYARGRSIEIIRHRKARYPYKNTCGSFFRNFHDDEVTLVSNGKKVIWIAYYLDKIGVKGTLCVGGATVSYQHANMIVTTEQATSDDIINLARTMQKMVKKEFGIVPKTECIMIGFKEYPLFR
jgi:UDP-N-acetylmuramate dehydrogenase